MSELLPLVLALGPIGILLFAVGYLIANPDKAYRWSEIFWALARKIWKAGDRRAVQHGLQGRVDRFARELATETGRQQPPPIKVQWTDEAEEQRHFFEDNRLVVRVHRYERQDRNLVTASLLYVSETMAKRAKRFLSKSQARATDLYAVDKLLAQAPPARELFHEEIMGVEADASEKIHDLIEQFQRMDQASLFFPVYVRELNHLGRKVVIRPRDERLIVDVEALITMLVNFAERVVGEEGELVRIGNELRCAIMIIAKRIKRELGDIGPYARHLDELARKGIETTYLIGSGDRENHEFMDQVAEHFCTSRGWRRAGDRTYTGTINVPSRSGDSVERRPATTYLIVLRHGGAIDDEDDR